MSTASMSIPVKTHNTIKVKVFTGSAAQVEAEFAAWVVAHSRDETRFSDWLREHQFCLLQTMNEELKVQIAASVQVVDDAPVVTIVVIAHVLEMVESLELGAAV